MKKIFNLILLILGQIIESSSIYSKATHDNLAELGKLIEALPDDHEFLEDKLAPVEKEHLEPTADPDEFNMDRGTDASKQED